VYLVILISLTILSIFSFHLGYYFPIGLSVTIFFILTLKNFSLFRKNKISLLSLLFYLIYSLPFIHLLEYFWTDLVNDTPIVMWGLLTRESMLDYRVVSLTGMIGCSGAMGISIGFSIKRLILKTKSYDLINPIYNYKSINPLVWVLMLIVALVLSNLTAPESNIFKAGYGESTSALDTANFSSSWMISYSLLTFLFVDSIMENNFLLKKIKWFLIFTSIIYILIFNQLLRGDRDALPWVISLLMIYFYWNKKIIVREELKNTLPPFKLVFSFFLIFIASMLLGMFRNSVADINSLNEIIAILITNSSLILSNIFHGTWSAVLLTPLSLANDYIYNSLEYNFGQDYIDLFLSSPPGFIADMFGYSRPWDINPDPAMKLVSSDTPTGGGMHLSAMAFWNFSMTGVILIGFIWGYLIKTIESFSFSRSPFLGITLVGVITLAIPHALWYGEKNLLNAFIIWIVFYKSISLFLNRI
jgi:hypothetical protein